MYRIKVDTDLLRRNAEKLRRLAGSFDSLGNELAQASAGVPSYDGQLSGPAREAGAVSLHDAKTLRDQLLAHSDDLLRLAQMFDDADLGTSNWLNDFWKWLKGEAAAVLSAIAVLVPKRILLGPPELTPENIIAFFSPYQKYQGDSSRCADFSLSMVCNIFYDAKGESTSRCDVDKITQYLESIKVGKFPNNGGTTPWGVEAALLMLGIPFSFHLQGTLADIENALQDHKIVMVSEGNVTFDKDKYFGLEVKLGPLDPKVEVPLPQFWGHVMVIVGEDGDDFLLLDPSKPNEDGVTRMKKTEFLENWWFPQFQPCWIIG